MRKISITTTYIQELSRPNRDPLGPRMQNCHNFWTNSPTEMIFTYLKMAFNFPKTKQNYVSIDWFAPAVL